MRWIAVLIIAPVAIAQDPSTSEFFESRIRPVLANNCYACHTTAASGGLRLDSREAAIKGGKSGPAIVPGDPDESILLQAARHAEGRPKMPPAGRLSNEELSDLVRWIRLGAVWPASSGKASTGAGYQITPAQRAFWSFQPLRKSTAPIVRRLGPEWNRHFVDQYIGAKLEEKRLAPAPLANKQALIRRATYDLTGLPPTAAEVDAFLADSTPGAYERLIDRLLASPRYGERWGRHWMDVVRYADTSGDASDYPIPQAAQYRDYIINSFNHDKPYDLFLREQIAGDLMPAASEAERWERTIATGYLAISRRFNVDPTLYMHMTVDDSIDNLGKTALGLTIACARCHDHKFDPISNRDYYALYGIFASSRYPFPGSEKAHRPKDLVARVPEEFQKVLQPYLAEIYKLSGRIGKLEGEKRAYVRKEGEKRTLEDILAEIEQVKAMRAPLLANMPKIDQAYAMADSANPADARIQIRGDHKELGAEVPRGFLQILGGQQLASPKTSGRLELAAWITDPANPLTPRVMVNRIWQHHFGRGLVATPSDYGKRGSPPTHPELLDALAVRFIESGWSIKSMHRLLMTSRAYQLASEGPEPSQAVDPSNEFVWKHTRRRLDAEQLRDTLLAVSGEIEWGPPGMHPFPHMATWNYMQHGPFADVYESNRRGVYLMTQRIQRHPYLGMFDGADPAISVADRPATITPIQALHSMNSEFIHARTRAWAARLERDEAGDAKRQLTRAFRDLLGRSPTPDEIALGTSHVSRAGLASFLRVLAASNEFLFVE